MPLRPMVAARSLPQCVIVAMIDDRHMRDENPRTVAPASDVFEAHSQRLLFCLKWCDIFPRPLLAQWESSVKALDARRAAESLRLLAALSASFDESRNLFEPRARDLFPAMRFGEQAPRIAREIHFLIQYLERILARTAEPA